MRPLHFTCVVSCAGLAYNQVPGASLGDVYGPGNFASGYLYAATALWEGGLGDAIEQQIEEGCRSITIAGASLGGAVAQLLAVRIEVRQGQWRAGSLWCRRWSAEMMQA